MILVDTSVWIDHLRLVSAALEIQLRARQVVAHPFVIGELLWTRDKRLNKACLRLGVETL